MNHPHCAPLMRLTMGRRRLLQLLALAPLALTRVAGAGPSPADPAQALLAVLPDPQAAAELGAAYLAAHPHEADGARLRQAIETSGAAHLPRDAPASAAALRDWLARLIRAEYAAGEGVLVGDWLLSPSEARLYAIAAVLEAG